MMGKNGRLSWAGREIKKEGLILEKFFRLTENKTSIHTEIFAGLITFMTMAYILLWAYVRHLERR